MDSSEADLDRVEAQRSTDVSRGQRKRRYFLVSLIKRGISRIFRSLGPLQDGVQLGSYSVSRLFSDFRLSDFFAFSGVYVPMSPEIFSAVSEGDAECMTKLRSSVTPAECLRSDQGDSVLHLAAAGGHVELVKTIASTWPFLLMELDSKDQLPLHVAARARHGSVVNTLIDIVTFLSNKMSAARSERLNPYVLKNKDGDTALHLAMKCLNVYCVIPLGETYPQAWFLANNKGISPLFIAVQEGFTELVKYLLENLDNDETDLQLEGRKDLVHVALKARNTDIIDVILKKYPSLENERDEEGMTCLSFGASIGFYKGVCNLLDRSTRGVYECNDDGSFPIHIAVQKCHMGVVFAILIRCPNSKHLLNRKGQNILHIASRSGKAAFFLSVLLERTSKVQLMEKQDIDGNTPLHLATISWRPRTIYLLLFHYKGKCMNTVNNDGLTSLGIVESNLQPNYIFMVGKVIYPIGYGADPTGRQDSSDAVLAALTDAFKLQTGLHMMPHVADLGGIVIDLQGGNYKIGKPLRFPSSGGGNLVVKGGTFRASNVFPGNRHLIELVPPNSGIFFEDVTFRDILFDSSFRGGGILVINSARIRITDCYFLHFTTQGVNVKGGHETYISNSFFGQHSTVGGDKKEPSFSGTGIDLSSTDNAITDVVIFSAGIGISLSGEANMVTGVHCYNKATWFGGIGILVKSHLTRIDNCYLDYTGIVIEDPVHVHVTNALFIGDANIVLRSVHGKISGLNIVNNMFRSKSRKNFPIVKVKGNFHEIDQVVIDQNNVSGMMLKSTIGKSKVYGNGTRWVVDFSHVLVFPNRINHYQHSFLVRSGQIVASAVTEVANNVVVVETDRAVAGTVSVIVHQ